MRALFPFLMLGVIGAPGLAGAAGDMPAFKVERWVNSTPLTPEALRGKVGRASCRERVFRVV